MLYSVWATGCRRVCHDALGCRTPLNVSTGIAPFSQLFIYQRTPSYPGLGDVTPLAPSDGPLVVVEAGIGFGFLAIVHWLFFQFHQAFSRREVSISLLDARAGVTPSAGELLRRHGQI